MPAFILADFLTESIVVWTDHPVYAVLFCATCLVLAWRFAFLSKIKIVQRHEMDDREPEPLRRVVLDATARFPPRASDRRAS